MGYHFQNCSKRYFRLIPKFIKTRVNVNITQRLGSDRLTNKNLSSDEIRTLCRGKRTLAEKSGG